MRVIDASFAADQGNEVVMDNVLSRNFLDTHAADWQPWLTQPKCVEQQEREMYEACAEREVRLRREKEAGPPPRREHQRYQHNMGDDHFRSDRARWFQAFTGTCLTGSIDQQNAQFDAIARRFRAYSDGRRGLYI